MSDDIETAAPKSKTGLIVMVAVSAVLVVGGGVAFAMMKGKHGETEAHGKSSEKKLGTLVAVDDFIVNLNEPRSTRYLKVRFTLELGEATPELLGERKDVVRDAVLTYLSGLTVDDVRGADTKDALREEIAARVSVAVGMPGGIKSVMFTEFVVQ